MSIRVLKADGISHETVLEVTPGASSGYFMVLPSVLVTSTSSACTTLHQALLKEAIQ